MIAGVSRRSIQVDAQGSSEPLNMASCSDDSTNSEASGASCSSTTEKEFQETTENYVDWIRRATRIVLGELEKAGLEDWVTLQRRWKWRWAGHCARRTDGRWANEVLAWLPEQGRRNRGHPLKRWQDSVNGYLHYLYGAPADSWMAYAGDRDEWCKLESQFAKQDWSL